MHSASTRPLCGLVLAGGRSSRMGRDKAAMVHPDGPTMARKCHDLLREAGCEVVAVSLRHDQKIPEGLREIADLQVVRDPAGESLGPLAGIVAGLSLRPDADWVVVACDLPRLDLKTVFHLLASRLAEEKFLAYRSEADGLPEPLCAIYSPGALPVLQRAMAEDVRSLRKILLANDCRLLAPVTSGALDNANTPADWESSVALPDWRAELSEIWISPGNDFRGRHGLGRLDHGIIGLPRVECVAGMGLRGDRYFGYKADFKGQVTFFDANIVEELRDHFAIPALSSAVLRRNLIVRGIDFADWVGGRFRFQGIDFQATEECKPCYWMNEAVAPGAEDFLQGNFRGGLRAKILTDGILRIS